MNHPALHLLFASLVACSAFGPPARAQERRPNLLVIQTDEHNFRTLGCYRTTLPAEQAEMWGPAVVETPHIDWIAQQGALCTSFYATTPVCSPSRAAFVSGRYPQNTPVVTNNVPLDDGIVTFAEVLRRRGWSTGYAGKWHLDGTGKPQWAPERSFGFGDNRYMFNRGHWKQLELAEDGPRVKARNAQGKPGYGVQGADETSFTTDFLTDRTIEFLRTHKDEPFCWMVSYPDPHGPNTVRPPYDTMYAEVDFATPRTFTRDGEGLPSWATPKLKRPAEMARYYGMVKCIDDNVGRILAALREEGLLEHTIVVFTADHGDLCGEHGKANKSVPFEASAKVPFVVRAPGRIEPGTTVDEALGCVDFLPTILALMDVPVAGDAEGRDASQLLRTGKAPENWDDLAFLRGTGNGAGSTWLAAVTDRYKLIYSAHDDPWLFDLEEDPDELVNRFDDPDLREIVRELSRALVSYDEDYDDPYVEDRRIAANLRQAIGDDRGK